LTDPERGRLKAFPVLFCILFNKMLRRFRLQLSDRRLRAALRIIGDCRLGIGDLAASPGVAAAFFKPLRKRLAGALAAPPASAAGSAAAAAAEDLAGRLEKFFTDLALHGMVPDQPIKNALLCLQKACGEAPSLLSLRRRTKTLAGIHALSAAAQKELRLARRAARSAGSDFPANLKFDTMYSGLDAVLNAFMRCAAALYEA